jgi:hypothetical protein
MTGTHPPHQTALFKTEPETAHAEFESDENEFESGPEFEPEFEPEPEPEPEGEYEFRLEHEDLMAAANAKKASTPLRKAFTGSAHAKTLAQTINRLQRGHDDAPHFLILIDMSYSMKKRHGAMSQICSTVYNATRQIPGAKTTIVQMGGKNNAPFRVHPDKASGKLKLAMHAADGDYLGPSLQKGLQVVEKNYPNIKNRTLHVFVLSDGDFEDDTPIWDAMQPLKNYPRADITFLLSNAYQLNDVSGTVQSHHVLDKGMAKIMQVISKRIQGTLPAQPPSYKSETQPWMAWD